MTEIAKTRPPVSKAVAILFIIIGLLIFLPLLLIMQKVAPLMTDPAAAISSGRLNGSVEAAQYVRLTLGGFAAFGFLLGAGGLYSLITHKSARLIMILGRICGLAALAAMFKAGSLL